mgnify:CR=1 FL=1
MFEGALRHGPVPVAVDREGHEAGGDGARCSAGPAEQAGEIAWTPDGGRVAFIVNGYQLRLFDAPHRRATSAPMSLIEPDGFPSSRIARGVTFSANGAAVTFDDCRARHSGCKPAFVAIKR